MNDLYPNSDTFGERSLNVVRRLVVVFTLLSAASAMSIAAAATVIDPHAFAVRDSLRSVYSPNNRLAAFAGNGSQTQRRQTVVGSRSRGESGSQPNSNGGANSGTNTGGRRTPTSRGTMRTAGGGNTRIPRNPATVAVTFVSDAPGTEIILTGRSIGVTGEDGRLMQPVARGIHTAVARRAGRSTLPRVIEVNASDMTFTLMVGGGTIERVDAEAVINRYLDPQQTDRVTLAEWQQALAQLNSALANDQMNTGRRAQALFATGQVAYLRRDYASALVSFGQATMALPTSPLAFYGLGNAYLATNQPAQAISAYEQAVRLSIQIEREMAMAHRGLGDALTRQRRYSDALRHYERARVLGYASPEMSLQIARSFLRARRWEPALRELIQLSQTSPSLEVFISLGDAHVGMEQREAAVEAYRQAIQINERSAVAHYKLGEALVESRDYAAAREVLERALGLDPTGALIDRERARRLANQAAERMRRG